MVDSDIPFEAEIRCHFRDPEEAYQALPFLHASFEYEMSWTTRLYGLALFKSGYLLRASEVVIANTTRYYLGWKGPDIGRFANIRREIGEESTNGITDSEIIRVLGGNVEYLTHEAVIREYERLGHREFMVFGGNDRFGYDEALDIKIKLMFCQALKWPLLVELEKIASTEEEARRCENDLQKLSNRFQLQNYLVREEPPTLLYDKLFGHEDITG